MKSDVSCIKHQVIKFLPVRYETKYPNTTINISMYFSNGIAVSCLHVELAQVPPKNTSYQDSLLLA